MLKFFSYKDLTILRWHTQQIFKKRGFPLIEDRGGVKTHDDFDDRDKIMILKNVRAKHLVHMKYEEC